MRAHVGITLGVIPSVQSPKVRLLLANHEDKLHGIHPQIRQVPVICTNIKRSSEGAYIHEQPRVIYRMGN